VVAVVARWEGLAGVLEGSTMKLWGAGRHGVSVQAVGFVIDATHVVSLGVDDELVACETATGNVVSLKPSPRRPRSKSALQITIAKRLHYLYADPQGDVILLDLEGNREVRRFVGHTEPVLSLAYCGAKKLLVTGSNDRTMRVWDFENAVEHLSVNHPDLVNCVCVSVKGDYLASGSKNGEILVWKA
jgi:WD40 repeat protein